MVKHVTLSSNTNKGSNGVKHVDHKEGEDNDPELKTKDTIEFKG